MKGQCLFCKIYKNKEGILFENIHFYSKYDINPVAPGHVRVIPNQINICYTSFVSSLKQKQNYVSSTPAD